MGSRGKKKKHKETKNLLCPHDGNVVEMQFVASLGLDLSSTHHSSLSQDDLHRERASLHRGGKYALQRQMLLRAESTASTVLLNLLLKNQSPHHIPVMCFKSGYPLRLGIATNELKNGQFEMETLWKYIIQPRTQS